MTDRQKAKLLLSCFPGRDDSYGAGRGACIKESLTESVILRHITGRERIGRYLLRRDSRIGALAVDMDENDLYAVMEYCDRCAHYWLTAHVERSKSKGYHLWWSFDEPISARTARLVASYILDECELLNSVEIFPKQDFLRPGGFGSYINLPEFGRDVRRGRTVFLDPRNGYKPYADQWDFLASRPQITERQLDEIIELNSLDEQPPSLVAKAEDETAEGYEGMGLPCFSRMMREGVEEGMRNEAALRLSVSLYRTGIPKDLGLVMMGEWNMRNRPPLETTELERAVSNGYLGRYGYGCFSTAIRRFCDHSCPVFRKHNSKRSLRDGLRRRSGYGRSG